MTQAQNGIFYLCYFVSGTTAAADVVPGFNAYCLDEGLMLIHSGASRSDVYHAVKRALPPDTPLLVAPLADAPKFKGMAPGALKWMREQEALHGA